MRFLVSFARFWYSFIIGDDWKIAIAVVASLCTAVALLAVGTPDAVLLPVTGLLIVVAFTIVVILDVRTG
ncbi:MAG: hypothetical protein ACRDZ4_03040 [Egibacteraceae bacterium]